LIINKKKEADMLILTRKIDEKIIINDNITITLVEINGKQVKLGIEAPKNIGVDREEIFNKKKGIKKWKLN